MRPGAKRPPTHPAEPACPCCLPALGEFGEMPPHGGLAVSIGEPPTATKTGLQDGAPGRAGAVGPAPERAPRAEFARTAPGRYSPRRRIRLVAYGARLESGLG